MKETGKQITVIAAGSSIELTFMLLLEDGTVIDDSSSKKTAECKLGDASLLPYIEQKLIGLKAGATTRFSIIAKDGFGEYNILNKRQVPANKFNNIVLKVGEIVMFSDGVGGSLPGVVKTITVDWIEIDFNHPLAGKNLIFECTILNVKN